MSVYDSCIEDAVSLLEHLPRYPKAKGARDSFIRALGAKLTGVGGIRPEEIMSAARAIAESNQGFPTVDEFASKVARAPVGKGLLHPVWAVVEGEVTAVSEAVARRDGLTTYRDYWDCDKAAHLAYERRFEEKAKAYHKWNDFWSPRRSDLHREVRNIRVSRGRG